MNFSFWVHKYSGHKEEEEKGGVYAGQVHGVHIQEWVHVCGLFARNSLIDVVFPQLFKSPDVHSHGVALAVVVFGTQSAHSLMDIFLREQIGKKTKAN